MEARHALLIGVPRCGNDEIFAPIPDDVIAKDMTRMGRALSQSGYQITVLGTRPADDVPLRQHISEEPTRSRCLDEIQEACNRVPADGTLLIYFSGHGVRIGGADYLVPQDVSRLGPDGKLQKNRLVPVNFSEEAALCQARTVLCIVDACRDQPADAGIEPESGQSLPHLPTGSFVLVRGCGPGEVCGWQEGQGSFFTRAIAGALRRNESPRTLGQVLQATRDNLRGQDSDQHPEPVYVGSEIEVLSTVICDGIAMLEDWRTAVTDNRLWTLVAEQDQVEDLRTAVRGVVAGFGKLVGEQRDRLAEREKLGDPWTDDGYPGRVLDALYLLLTPPGRDVPVLPAAEVAALVAAPFLREAILALALFDVPELRPRDFTRHFGEGLRADLENVFANQEQLTRRAEGLADRLPEARDMLAMWLVDRWLLEREDLWEGSTAAARATDLARSVLVVAEIHPGEGRVREFGQMLLAMARSIASVLGPGDSGSKIVRLRPLGHLLSLAGILGGDPRRVGGIVADHIGTQDGVGPHELRAALSTEVTWRRDGDELVVDAVCGHPAIHAALAGLADEADATCGVTRSAAATMPAGEKEILAGVPVRCREDLRPEKSAYDKPLLRFHLAGDRIRDLLMGTQLYGDAAIAIRELYQNALDACRYRHMRLRCEFGTETPPGWRGRIVLRQGVEEETGRRYIECEDNGIGMSEAVLNHTFTAAGTRFVHSEAFRREEARWRRVDPSYRLYPNSQFGIGVFSYFMLADEMSLWTAATDDRGTGVQSRMHLHIPGHGGLFRLLRDGTMPEGIRAGGTTVRLYLLGNLKVSAADTLADHLVYADYEVEVWTDGKLIRHWRPGVPVYNDGDGAPPHIGVDGVWWVSGPGRPLSDGIRVASIRGQAARGEWFGRLINLTGSRQPRLSVDRANLLDWDQEWADRRSRSAIPALAAWAGFTWQWLWKVIDRNPQLAQDIFEQHLDHEIPVSEKPDSPAARVGTIGCLSLDEAVALRPGALVSAGLEGILSPWRRALWRQMATGTPAKLPRFPGEPANVAGYPLLDPRDHLVVEYLDDVQSLDDYIVDASLPEAAELVYRLRRLVLAGLDLRALREVDGEDHPLVILALVAWSHLPDEDDPLPVRLLWLAGTAQFEFHRIHESLNGYASRRGVHLTPPSSAVDRDFVPDPKDLRFVSRDYDSASPWRVNWSARDLQSIGQRTSEPAEEIHGRLDTLRDWGFSPPAIIPADPSPDDKDARALHSCLAQLSGAPTVHDVVGLALDLGAPTRKAHDLIVEAIEPFRMAFDETMVAGDLFAADITTADTALLGRYPAAGQHETINWLARDRREHFAGRPSSEAAAVYARNAFVFGLPKRITSAHLVELAHRLRASIGYAEEVMREIFSGWRDVPEPGSIPAEVAAVRPTSDETTFLVDETGWRPFTPALLTRFAQTLGSSIGEALDRISPYRLLGVNLPRVDRELSEYRPDSSDDVALSMAVPSPEDAVVSALRLIRMAGRLGWTVRQAWDRLDRFASLGVQLQPSREQCPSEIVHWADLIVLTRHLDGWEPELSGTVTADEIRRAAEAVRETPEETRARLLRYAGLFAFVCEELT